MSLSEARSGYLGSQNPMINVVNSRLLKDPLKNLMVRLKKTSHPVKSRGALKRVKSVILSNHLQPKV